MKNKDFINQIRSSAEQHNRILKLQQDFENNNFNEEELSKEEINKLEQLYKQQIENLQREIRGKKRKINEYKMYILKEINNKKSNN